MQRLKKFKNMEREKLQNEGMKKYWQLNKEYCRDINSITLVYKHYLEYILDRYEPVDEYKFRAYIRRHGYNNGSGHPLSSVLLPPLSHVKVEGVKSESKEEVCTNKEDNTT